MIVVLEGCSGTGKTTQLKEIIEILMCSKYSIRGIVEKNYEPFKSEVENWHRIGGVNNPFTKEVITSFAKARAETYNKHFAKMQEDILLFDRYLLTSAVYQSGKLTPKQILDINLEKGCRHADLTFLLQCSPEVSFQRAVARNSITGGKHLFSTSPEKIEQLRKRYFDTIKYVPNVSIVNSDCPKNEISSKIISKIIQRLSV